MNNYGEIDSVEQIDFNEFNELSICILPTKDLKLYARLN